jgi:F-type H+-transporting ATPase subunit b
MLIDWFTVIAQIVNFLLLVWLLKRFLFRRILDAIAARENRIAERLADTDVKERQAGEQLALYQARLHDLEQQQASVLAQAEAEAQALRAKMLEGACEEIRAQEAKWREELEREQGAFLLELRSRAAAVILDIARRTVADLAGLDVQECAVRNFLGKIQSMDEHACERLGNAELLVRSPLDLPDDSQTEIRQTLEERLQTPVALRFERTPGIGLGIELRGNGWRVGWTSSSYLEGLEDDLMGALETGFTARAHAGGA